MLQLRQCVTNKKKSAFMACFHLKNWNWVCMHFHEIPFWFGQQTLIKWCEHMDTIVQCNHIGYVCHGCQGFSCQMAWKDKQQQEAIPLQESLEQNHAVDSTDEIGSWSHLNGQKKCKMVLVTLKAILNTVNRADTEKGTERGGSWQHRVRAIRSVEICVCECTYNKRGGELRWFLVWNWKMTYSSWVFVLFEFPRRWNDEGWDVMESCF